MSNLAGTEFVAFGTAQLAPALGGVLNNDTDADGNQLRSTLVTNVSNGTLTLNGDGTFVYTPNANFFGTDTFTYRANDGALDSNIATVTITVNPVDDAPVNSVPAAQSTNEDTALVFSAGNGNLVSISDVDAGAASVQVQLTVTNGTLTLSGTAGLTLVAGGSGTATMTYTGTIASWNAAMAGMSYAPTANYTGAATLTIVTNDLGNSGAGGPLTDTDVVNITVNPVERRAGRD